MTVRLLLTILLCCSSSLALAGKKNSTKKKREPKAFVRARHNQKYESGTKTHEISVSVFRADNGGVSGTIYAIYKNKSGGGVYTAQKETLTIEVEKDQKKKKKSKDKKDEKKSQRPKPQNFTFPHSNGTGTFVDFLVILNQGGKIVSTASNSSMWKSAAENLAGNAEGPFNSSGKPVEASEDGDGREHAIDNDMVEAGKRLRARIEAEQKNKKLEKDMNK